MYYDIVESGKRIKEMRKKKGMTQEELSDAIAVSPFMIGKIERGESGTTIDTMGRMTEILGTSVDYHAYGGESTDLEFMGLKIP